MPILDLVLNTQVRHIYQLTQFSHIACKIKDPKAVVLELSQVCSRYYQSINAIKSTPVARS